MADPLADDGGEAAGVAAPASPPVPLPVQRLVRVNFDVPDDLHRRIRMKAFSEGRSLKDVARELLHHWVNE